LHHIGTLARCLLLVESGKEADLLAERGDALVDIRCLNDVALVMRAGKVVCPASAADLLDNSL
jgi:hypothetical protein